MYVKILGSWAIHCEYEITICPTILGHIWLLVDGSLLFVTRPRCILSFRAKGRQTWRWHVRSTNARVQYNEMLVQWISPATRAHNDRYDRNGWLIVAEGRWERPWQVQERTGRSCRSFSHIPTVLPWEAIFFSKKKRNSPGKRHEGSQNHEVNGLEQMVII